MVKSILTSALLALSLPALAAETRVTLEWDGNSIVEVTQVIEHRQVLKESSRILTPDHFGVYITNRDGTGFLFIPEIRSVDDALNWQKAEVTDVDVDGDTDIRVKQRAKGKLLPHVYYNEKGMMVPKLEEPTKQ